MSYGFGWIRDLPDMRDYTESHPDIDAVLKKSRVLKGFINAAAADGEQPAIPSQVNNASHVVPPRYLKEPATAEKPIVKRDSAAVGAAPKLPTSFDLRSWCSPIEDQGNLGSCTANACIGLLEYYEQRAFGKYLNASRLFVYKASRYLLGWTGDTGSYLRTTMKALTLFGAPPEQYWPYVESKYDLDPPSFVNSLAQNFKAVRYYRLDPAGTTPTQLLSSIKTKLSAGLPSMFGFTVYSSISNSPNILFPKATDKIMGGHAVVTVGYDDSKKIGSETGALLIRNSWGTGWGDAGYGWLPYAYVTKGLAADFWSLVQASFVDSDLFR